MKKILLIILFFLISGCSSMSTKERYEASFYATAYAKDGVIPPAKYQTMAATALNFYFPTSTPTPDPHWTPTMSGFDFANTQSAQIQNNAMTAQAQQQAYELEKIAAEQRAVNAKSTAEAHAEMMTAQARATYMQGTAYAEATNVQGTQYVQATATERAIQVSAAGTGTAFAVTQVYQPTSDILTLQAVRVQQTVQAGEAEKVELAVRRQSAKNYLDAFLPWGIVVALAFVFSSGFSTWVKLRIHPRDEHGRMQTMTRELPDGGVVIIKPEQLESGVAKITGDGSVIRYAPMDKQEQSDINRRAQAVEAIAALPTPYAQKGPQLLSGEFGRSTPRVNFVTGSAMNPVLDEADDQLLGGGDE